MKQTETTNIQFGKSIFILAIFVGIFWEIYSEYANSNNYGDWYGIYMIFLKILLCEIFALVIYFCVKIEIKKEVVVK